jgi:hypothetical protein
MMGAMKIAIALAALSVALVTAALISPTPRSYDLGAPGDAYVGRNFYGPEREAGASFRWSGPDAALIIPDPYARMAVLNMRLHGNPNLAPLALYGGAGDAPIAQIRPGPVWRVYRLLVPHGQLWDSSGRPATIRLTVDAGPPRPDDPRALGVAIDYLSVQPLAGGPAGLAAAFGAALLLCWAAALLTAGAWLAARSLAPPAAAPALDRAMLGCGALLGAGLALWAWRAPDTLRWALPLSWPWPSAASLAMLTLWGASSWRAAGGAPRRAQGMAALATAGVAGLAHLLLLLPFGADVRGLAALAILGLPGALLARLLLRDEPDRLEQIFFGLCGALALPALLLMALQLLPGPLPGWLLLVLCDAQSALVGLALLRRPAPRLAAPAGQAHPLLPLGLIMLLAAAFRLPFLGRPELHDDEASAIAAAARLVAGQPDQLMIQLKGPAQSLLPAGPIALSGQISELVARAPFALAGLGVVLGGYLLARRMLGAAHAPAALLVALLLALDGFLIAFSRIIQYQSIVMIMGLGAAICCWRFYRGEGRPLPQLVAAAILLALGLLGHYDAIYGAPALAWLVLAGGRRRGWRPADWLRGLAAPVGIGAALLGSFYLPFALHPHFSKAADHIGERSGQQSGGWALYNNLGGSYFLASFYTTAPALWALIGGAALTLAAASLIYVRPRPLGGLLAGLILASAADLLRGPDRSLLMGAPGLVALACALPLLGLILAPATPAALRLALIWFVSAAVPIGFLLAQPRTHMHVADIPATMIVGWGLAALAERADRRGLIWPQLALGLAATALVAVASPYAYALFVRQTPEYQREFPMAHLAAYPALAADRLDSPIGGSGRLGYPAEDGWKTIGELYRRGVLHGPFASNQSTELAGWYTRGLLRCGATPNYYLIAGALLDPPIPASYHLFGAVVVDGQRQLSIYSRSPVGSPPQIFDAADFRAAFDNQPLPVLPPAEAACGQG